MSLPEFNRASFPEMYEGQLVLPLFRPFAEALLDITPITVGSAVLDVACGTGIVARLARERAGETARIVGIDISPAMLDVARRVAPDIDWRTGSADQLPLHDGESFDIVVSHQGLQFFPDKPAAIREMIRALRAGGTLAVATWSLAKDVPLYATLQQVAERHVGPINDRRYGFGELDALAQLLLDAGLRDVEAHVVNRTVRFDEGVTFVRLNAGALVGMSSAGQQLDEQGKAAVMERIVEDSLRETGISSTPLEFDASTLVAVGKGEP